MISGFSGSGRRAALLGAVLISGVWTLGTAQPAEAAPGDLNDDGFVTTVDAALALRLAGGLTKATAQTRESGDVAGGPGQTPDGRVGLMDAVRIARAANGLDDLGGGPGADVFALAKMDTVTFAGNFSKSYKLDQAYSVTGTVTDMNGQSISSFVLDGQAFLSTSGTIGFDHVSNYLANDDFSPEVGETAFEVHVAKGTNNVTISTYVNETNTGNGTFKFYSVVQNAVPSTLNVTGNMTGVVFKRPNLPAPGTLAGAVSGSNFTPNSIMFSSESGLYASSQVTGNSYSMVSGPGTGSMTLSGTLAGDPSVQVQMYQYGSPVTVNSGATTTRNISVPTLAILTGAVTAPAGLKANSASINNSQEGQNSVMSSNSLDNTDQDYKLAAPPGTYDLIISLPERQFGTARLNLSHSQKVTLNAGNNTKNVTMPAVPANVAFTGTITGPNNAPLPDTSVFAFGQVANGYTAAAYTDTGADGTFALTLPPGTYQIGIYPD